MPKIEFYFDLSSPWTYLAFNNIQPLVAETGAEIRWVPILVGGVFNAVNKGLYEQRANAESPKILHVFKTLDDWAALSGIEMNFPPPTHPARSVHAMRVCCALEDDQGALAQFAGAAFAAYFGENRDLDDPTVLASVADGVGLDGAALVARTQDDAVKARLRSNTEEVIARGGYGSPTIFVNGDDMYFGNDQMPLIRRAVTQG